jgi:hypothetical protein
VYRIVFTLIGVNWMSSSVALARHAAGSSLPCSAASSVPAAAIAPQTALWQAFSLP